MKKSFHFNLIFTLEITNFYLKCELCFRLNLEFFVFPVYIFCSFISGEYLYLYTAEIRKESGILNFTGMKSLPSC